ncbi:MAG TPA: hypothetical protein ENK98_02230 [Epsilonproteobacteria bacterium]|nr:hypothetical protein [Campylobacterota bacterium]
MDFESLYDIVNSLDLSEMFTIKEEEIDQLITQYPSNYAYYAVLSAQAMKEKNKAKFDLSIVEAEMQKRVREDAVATNTKMTEKAVDVAVKMSAEYRSAYNKMLLADEASNILRGVLAGLDKYGDAIHYIGKVQLAEMAKEMKGSL